MAIRFSIVFFQMKDTNLPTIQGLCLPMRGLINGHSLHVCKVISVNSDCL